MQVSSNAKCTLLVSSCDRYSDAWEPFFKLLNIQWSDCPFPMVLCTESKRCDRPGVQTFSLYNSGERIPWGKKLIDHLAKIKTEYVLFMLDDFFLESPVPTEKVLQCLSWMDEDPSVTCFCFGNTSFRLSRNEHCYPGFVRRARFDFYRFNCQATIWRTRDLIGYLRPHEDPWLWETVGNLRSWRIKKAFYQKEYDGHPMFDYSLQAIVRGKWARSHVEPLFKKYGIQIDYDALGILPEEETYRRFAWVEQNKLLYWAKTLCRGAWAFLTNPKSWF